MGFKLKNVFKSVAKIAKPLAAVGLAGAAFSFMGPAAIPLIANVAGRKHGEDDHSDVLNTVFDAASQSNNPALNNLMEQAGMLRNQFAPLGRALRGGSRHVYDQAPEPDFEEDYDEEEEEDYDEEEEE